MSNPIVSMKQTKSEKNKIKKELKDDTMKLLNEVEDNIKVRTRNDYFFELENADKINVISRIQRELKKIKSALKIAKPGEQLTKQKTNEIIKAEKTRKDNLLSEIRHAKKKKDELTFEQKVKREEKERKKYERNALGGVYKKSFVYADDIDGVFGFESDIFNKTSLGHVITKMLLKDFENMTRDKKFKCSLRSFVSIKTLLAKQNDEEEEFEKDHYFNSIAFDVMALNNIPEIVNNIVQAYVISLEEAKIGSNWRFKCFLKFTVASSVIKSALGKSYIELP